MSKFVLCNIYYSKFQWFYCLEYYFKGERRKIKIKKYLEYKKG